MVWSKQEKQEFKLWHNNILLEKGYTGKVLDELMKACDEWLVKIPLKRIENDRKQ